MNKKHSNAARGRSGAGIDARLKAFLATVAAVVFTAAAALCYQALHSPVPVFAETMQMRVVLDAGHGGIDGGVVGRVSKVKESEVNLAITMKLKTVLEGAGFDVTLTRKTDAGLYGAATRGFKKRDMQKRKEIIESVKPIAMISVHQNFYPTRGTRGGQAFYNETSEAGRRLAESIQERLNSLYSARGVKERTAASGDYYMLKCTSYTSVIVECGFLSNAADEALLLTEEFRGDVAQAIYAGLVGFLGA